jgi:hypothetical protein
MDNTKPNTLATAPAIDANAPYTIGMLDRFGNWQELNEGIFPHASSSYVSLADALRDAPAVIGAQLDVVIRDVAGRIVWRASEAK